jgi:hypothetical protein
LKPATPAAVYSESLSFELTYEVDDIGPSRLAGVEVWFTQDGQAWQRYPEQVKPLGAVPITVAKEGRYGFTLIARSGAGLSRPAPKPGEEPQIWVEVDAKVPRIRDVRMRVKQ